MNERNRPRRRLYVRIIMCGAALVTAWHVFASFLWIAPWAPIREVVGQDVLSSYMIPMFGQSWSVFAPEPVNGDYRFEVRAIVDGEETEWVSASDVELSMIRYNLFTPRAGIVGMDVSSQFKGAWGDLTDEQKDVAELNYFKADWEARMAEAMKEYDDTTDVASYIEQEHRATAYATQVALAIWGDDVERVQFSATRQNVIPFNDRHDPDAERPGIQYSPTGWRGLVINEGQSQEAFTDVFRAQHERMSE
ncbi:MAG TPA: hypothetical protein H9800_10745 [Candidatus Microbacterium stercoravium]|uniref:Uncharacterized protein n=1 Tax=Candidatus Microbacterium stercoravium TaxID=2838697 RepID=A0A9D2H671_9MICO|nr:hypothetical protein [Candidatus Microbacterium stercoravium]